MEQAHTHDAEIIYGDLQERMLHPARRRQESRRRNLTAAFEVRAWSIIVKHILYQAEQSISDDLAVVAVLLPHAPDRNTMVPVLLSQWERIDDAAGKLGRSTVGALAIGMAQTGHLRDGHDIERVLSRLSAYYYCLVANELAERGIALDDTLFNTLESFHGTPVSYMIEEVLSEALVRQTALRLKLAMEVERPVFQSHTVVGGL